MKYVRNYYKKTTLNVFKTRANFINNDFYIILHKMFQKLYNLFNEFN